MTGIQRPFESQSLYVKQQCAKSMWQCAQVVCQNGVSKTSLTQKTAETAYNEIKPGVTPMELAESRYNKAIQFCVDDRPPPPPALGVIFAEGGRPIEFYWDLNNWFSPVAPSPVVVTFLAGLATIAFRSATAVWSFITPPPPAYFQKPDII
jgi:hypothetical protein